jgi:hypothetical protein
MLSINTSDQGANAKEDFLLTIEIRTCTLFAILSVCRTATGTGSKTYCFTNINIYKHVIRLKF